MRFQLAVLAMVCILTMSACTTTSESAKQSPAPANLGTISLLEFENLTDQPNASLAVASVLRVELHSAGVLLASDSTAVADHLLTGRVAEYHYRHGLTEQSVVGFTLQLISVKTRKTVWSATYADRGAASFTGGESLTEVTRRICQKAAARLSNSP